jgi:outer membrane lipoprotein-sorting protein
MNKSVVLFALIIMCCSTAVAQDKEVILSNFKNLLKEAVTDFKTLRQEVLEIDSAKNTYYYKCSATLGSSFEAIGDNKNDSTVYYTCQFDYSITKELLKATEILPGILDIVNQMVKTGNYKGRDYVNQSKMEVTEVKDTDGNYILEIETGADNKFLQITIYGKSWGKK